MPTIALHILALALIGLGAWLVFAASVAAAFPDALGLDHALAGYRAGPVIARHTREIAVLAVFIGLLMFVAGTVLGARVIA
ncbi:hypothetical protein [Sphingomonas melonis]|uniref:hypothetical protein n=1 Tax=Sphingomonas melonis TaxID=152682 RepID=UPI0035C79FFB